LVTLGFKFFKLGGKVAISNYLHEELIVFLDQTTRDATIQFLVDLLDGVGRLKDKKAFHDALLEREKIVSTGIGLGIAIPHAKLEGYDDFFIAIGIQKNNGIDWKALDGSPVRIIFMIGGPENKQTEYLHILSRLTTAIKDPELRKQLLKASTAGQVLHLLKDF